MKRQNDKYKARNRKHADARWDWCLGKPCYVCRLTWAIEVHHIAGRNAKARDSVAAKYECVKNWLPVCRECHSIVDKESPAYTACAAKLLAGELDLRHLQDLRPGRRFALSISDLGQTCDDLKEWKK